MREGKTLITSIQMELHEPEKIKLNTNMCSLLHGYIMENINADFAEKMHISELRPFSMSLSRNLDKKWIWRVNTLTDEAGKNIITMLADKEKIYLSHKDLTLDILNYSVSRTDYDKLFENNYLTANASKYISFELITPTAFKSNGRYINYPDLKLIFMSIINKYDKNSASTSILDDNLIEELASNVTISKYNLRSTYFSLEGTKIPSYMGSMTIKINSNPTTVSLINMLTDFAQYSGVGIKTALGMGGFIKLDNNGRRKYGEN